MSCHDNNHEPLGLDFAQSHHIRCRSWHLGTFERGRRVRREWALRMQRQDAAGRQRSITWLHDLPGHAELDWDEAPFLLARDAGDGRQPFDACIEEHSPNATTKTSPGTSTATGRALSTCGTRSGTFSSVIRLCSPRSSPSCRPSVEGRPGSP